MLVIILLFTLLVTFSSQQELDCNCDTLELRYEEDETTIFPVLRGKYRKIADINGLPAYTNGKVTLHYNVEELAWGVADDVTKPVFRVLNYCGDACPYRLASKWSLIEDATDYWAVFSTVRFVCEKDPCSSLRCGFNAICAKNVCQCQEGHSGNPYIRYGIACVFEQFALECVLYYITKP